MGCTANKPTPAHCEHYNPVLMTHAQHQPRAQANRTSALPWIVVCGLNTARRCWGFFDSTGCGVKLGLVYAVSPRLACYSRGLSEPREILMSFSLYQRMYANNRAMHRLESLSQPS